MKNQPVPVTIFTGFLGSGKTTLLNHIIKSQPDKRFAIIENEFGEIPIDNALVVSNEEDLFTLQNGCICCSLQSDVLDILMRLAARKETIDHVIIESTGVADPAPVAQLFMNNMALQHYYRLNGVVCVVDAVNFHRQRQGQLEAIKQLAMADLMLINKTDKVTEEKMDLLEHELREINAQAAVIRTLYVQVEPDQVLSLRAYDLTAVEGSLDVFLSAVVPDAPGLAPLNPSQPAHQHASDHGIQTFSMEFNATLDFLKFDNWFNLFVLLEGEKLYRTKGIIHTRTSNRKIIFQSVHFEIDSIEGDLWGEEARVNRLVFIGKGLDGEDIRKSVLQCLA